MPIRVGERHAELLRLRETMQHELPRLKLSDDSHGRITDVAFDIGEYQKLSQEDVALAVRLAESRGARWSRSSVHFPHHLRCCR